MMPTKPRPSLATWGTAPMSNTWQVGCKGQGAATIQAICVKKNAISYTLGTLGQTQHYIDDQESYYAESSCADDEFAIGGMGGCNEMMPTKPRPSLATWGTAPMSNTWQVGCKGQGAAIIEAMCVKKDAISYTLGTLGQTQHYDNAVCSTSETCTNKCEYICKGKPVA